MRPCGDISDSEGEGSLTFGPWHISTTALDDGMRRWAAQADVDAGDRPGATSAELGRSGS